MQKNRTVHTVPSLKLHNRIDPAQKDRVQLDAERIWLTLQDGADNVGARSPRIPPVG